MTTGLIMAVVYCFRAIQKYAAKRASTLVTKRSVVVLFCLYQFALSAVLCVIPVLISGGFSEIDFASVFYGVLSGIAILLSAVCSLIAMKSGTVSLVTLFGMAGLIVPCFANQFFFQKAMSPMQWVGIAIFVLAAYLLVASSKNVFGKFSFKTLLLLLVALLSEGFTMVFQQLFITSSKEANVSLFTFISFLAVTLLMLPVLPIVASAEKEKLKPMNKGLIVPGIAASVSVLIISMLITYATSLSSPVIVFSLSAGGSMIVSALVARVCFKEKLGITGSAGILLGIVSMIFLKVFEI